MSAEDQIRQYAERIVRLEQERKALAEDIKECKAEAKAAGFSPKLIATCVRIMLMEAEKRAEALSGHEELDIYLGAVGLIARPEVIEAARGDQGDGVDAATAVPSQSVEKIAPEATAESDGLMQATGLSGAQASLSSNSRNGASESGSRPHCPQPQRKQPIGGDSSERRHINLYAGQTE